MFVNVGAYVGEGTMIDSHALVEVARRSAAIATFPPARRSVASLTHRRAAGIIEDDVLVGGNSGVYEGTVVKRRAILGTGTILNRSIPVYDLVRDAVYTATETEPLVIPKKLSWSPARARLACLRAKWGLSLQAA